MNKESGEKDTASLLVRLVGQRQYPWLTVGVSLVLLVAPIGAAYLDGILDSFAGEGFGRFSYLAPVVTIYILVITPIMNRGDASVVKAFRPLVPLGDEEFDRLVDEASRISPVAEGVAFGVGAAFGLWLGQSWLAGTDIFWLRLVHALTAGLMWGLLAWTIYGDVTTTRLSAELHRQPLRIDIFDTEPFEPIGRQSLIMALAFVGGIVLATVFVLDGESILQWQNLLIYFFLALVPILVFFLNMRGTHRVLAAEKERELEAVERSIRRACRTLKERVDAQESSGTLASEIDALVVYEERLQETRTWPYNTAMLRTLFVSVILPAGVAVAQRILGMLFE
jgi:hypothetical protein